jgi:hypothetical protein
MFSPSQQDVRRFFCQVYAKQLQGPLVDPLETLAAEWIDRHPEYHLALQNEEAALSAKVILFCICRCICPSASNVPSTNPVAFGKRLNCSLPGGRIYMPLTTR